MSTREELVKTVEDAWDAYTAAWDAANAAYDAASVDLADYDDKENT